MILIQKSLNTCLLLITLLVFIRNGESRELPLEPTFSSIKQNIIDARCVVCHNPNGHASELPFLKYSDVVDPQGRIVIPRNADESGMIIYTSLPDTCPERMPPKSAGPRLTKEQISVIRQWIDQGAEDN